MQKEIHYNGNLIRYTVTGNGKPVILLHGFGEDSSVWRYQAPVLQEKIKLIIPDLPGSGGSQMVEDMSVDGMAEVIHSIIHE